MDGSRNDLKRTRKEHLHRHANAHRLSEHSHQVRRVQPRILQKGLTSTHHIDARDLSASHETTDTESIIPLPEPVQLQPPILLPVEHRIVFKSVVPATIELRDAHEDAAARFESQYATSTRKGSQSPYLHTVEPTHTHLKHTQTTLGATSTRAPLIPVILSAASIESVLTALPSTVNVPGAISSLLQGNTTTHHTKTVTSTSSPHPTTLSVQPTHPSSPNSTWPLATSRLNTSSTVLTTFVTSSTSTSTTTTTTSCSMSGPPIYSTGVPGSESSYSSPSSTPTGAVTRNNGNSASFPTPTVVGSVVGGLAGLIGILLILLLLIRWWKRKQHLSPAALRSREPSYLGPDTTGPTPPPAAFLPGAAAALISRLSHPRLSQAATATSEPAPRSFERVSGRKLPSQFSPGIEGPGSNTGMHYPLGSSAYPSGGTFSAVDGAENPFSDSRAIESVSSSAAAATGGAAIASATAAATSRSDAEHDAEAMRPGPARRPALHTGTSDQRVPHSSYLATPRQTTETGISRTPTPTAGAFPRSGETQGLDQGLGMGIGFARGGAATPPRGIGSRTVSYDGSVRSGRSGRGTSRFYEDID